MLQDSPKALLKEAASTLKEMVSLRQAPAILQTRDISRAKAKAWQAGKVNLLREYDPDLALLPREVLAEIALRGNLHKPEIMAKITGRLSLLEQSWQILLTRANGCSSVLQRAKEKSDQQALAVERRRNLNYVPPKTANTVSA